ncbi:hypothetical protein JCM10449v2_003535 [Rhodotorula kratochvilovae]
MLCLRRADRGPLQAIWPAHKHVCGKKPFQPPTLSADEAEQALVLGYIHMESDYDMPPTMAERMEEFTGAPEGSFGKIIIPLCQDPDRLFPWPAHSATHNVQNILASVRSSAHAVKIYLDKRFPFPSEVTDWTIVAAMAGTVIGFEQRGLAAQLDQFRHHALVVAVLLRHYEDHLNSPEPLPFDKQCIVRAWEVAVRSLNGIVDWSDKERTCVLLRQLDEFTYPFVRFDYDEVKYIADGAFGGVVVRLTNLKWVERLVDLDFLD